MNFLLSVSLSKDMEEKIKLFHHGGNRSYDLWILSTISLLTELEARWERVAGDYNGNCGK